LPKIKVLILSVDSHNDHVLRLRNRARGYVLKNAPVEELVRAVETVQSGGTISARTWPAWR
jgi:DNA-binding NarL/FixJ family response regulator